MPSFSIASEDIRDNEALDPRFTNPSIGGQNLSPELRRALGYGAARDRTT